MEDCPPILHRNIPFLRADVVENIQKNTAPRCFHCGVPFSRDELHSKSEFSVWKPSCNCLNKPTIRVVTGGEIKIEKEAD